MRAKDFLHRYVYFICADRSLKVNIFTKSGQSDCQSNTCIEQIYVIFITSIKIYTSVNKFRDKVLKNSLERFRDALASAIISSIDSNAFLWNTLVIFTSKWQPYLENTIGEAPLERQFMQSSHRI